MFTIFYTLRKEKERMKRKQSLTEVVIYGIIKEWCVKRDARKDVE